MLEKTNPVVNYDESGKVTGVTCGEETVKAPLVIGDPSYFKEKVRKCGKVIRAICILKHPIPDTDNADSCQIILPQNQINRKHGTFWSELDKSLFY